MDEDDIKDHYREGTRSDFDSTAGDDLCRIAEELEHLRGFLLNLCRFRRVDAELLKDLIGVEEAVQEILAPRWNACQETLNEATEAELDEVDTTWFGKSVPEHFRTMTVAALQVAINREGVGGLRVPTNPATRGDL